MGTINPVSQEQFDEALKLLNPRAEGQEKAREDLLGLIGITGRHELKPKTRKARDTLLPLVKHIERASKALQRLHYEASFDLFNDREITDRYGSIDESEAQEILARLAKKGRGILDNNYAGLKRGQPKKADKRRFVRRAREIFDKWSEEPARRTSRKFLDFVDVMYEAATGFDALNDDWIFHRALNDEFAERPYKKKSDTT